MSKNKVWLTEYPLWKAVHDCIDMSQEENCNNMCPLLNFIISSTRPNNDGMEKDR